MGAAMTDLRKKKRIAVIGGAKAETEHLQLAEEVGRLIAKRGGILVCGGLGGVMEAASKGAKKAGGSTIGILPGKDRAEANAYIDIAIATGLGFTRNSLVAMNADAVIAVDGQYGTLSEIAYTLVYGKKVIGLETWDIHGVRVATSPDEAVKLAFEE